MESKAYRVRILTDDFKRQLNGYGYIILAFVYTGGILLVCGVSNSRKKCYITLINHKKPGKSRGEDTSPYSAMHSTKSL